MDFAYKNHIVSDNEICGLNVPDKKVYGANIRPTWGRQDPGGPYVGPMNLDIWGVLKTPCGPISPIVAITVAHNIKDLP